MLDSTAVIFTDDNSTSEFGSYGGIHIELQLVNRGPRPFIPRLEVESGRALSRTSSACAKLARILEIIDIAG